MRIKEKEEVLAQARILTGDTVLSVLTVNGRIKSNTMKIKLIYENRVKLKKDYQ